MRRAQAVSKRVLGAAIFVLGVAMIAITLARGGGPLAVGVFVGVAFAFLGWLRFTGAASADGR